MSKRLTAIKEQQQTTINMRLALVKSDKAQMLERHKKDRKVLENKLEARPA